MATQQQIIEAIAENLTLPPTDIDLESSLQDDLGLNPVQVADLFHFLSRRFSVVIDTGDVEQTKTIGDLIELIEDKLLE
ncbi:MAG: acyl carrier protein [Candidatus Daviesbacteria bacterium]|nr:acyl carrier protein [Candidatus Daviesbacteria bacterium]